MALIGAKRGMKRKKKRKVFARTVRRTSANCNCKAGMGASAGWIVFGMLGTLGLIALLTSQDNAKDDPVLFKEETRPTI